MTHLMKSLRKGWMLAAVIVVLISMAAVPTAVFAASSGPVTVEGSHYVAKGKKITLKANQSVKWKSSNKKIATVSAKGVVKGVRPGKVTITATSKANKSIKKKWKITVLKKPVSSVKIKAPKTSLNLKGQETVSLKAVVKPSASSKCIEWTSSDPGVASVDGKGKVTAVGAGKTKITAAATDGSKKHASVTITVKVDLKVGISIPTNEFIRWNRDGNRIGKLLRSSGYKTDLQFAGNNPEKQAEQIGSMVDSGCGIIVVAPVESDSLKTALGKAKKKGVRVIAYDRLLTKTNTVSAYITFNNREVGEVQGNFIKDELKLDSAKGPFNLEITAGDQRDDNARLFYEGAMDVLRPYIKSGKLVVRSGESSFSKVVTKYWMTSEAEARAKKIIKSKYGKGTNVDAWLCANDSTAAGVVNALKSFYKGKWPVITGQDCDIENVKNIIAGKQSMSVYKRTIDLADITLFVVNQLAAGKTLRGDAATDNGSKKVPTFYAGLTAITAENYSILIRDGMYSGDVL